MVLFIKIVLFQEFSRAKSPILGNTFFDTFLNQFFFFLKACFTKFLTLHNLKNVQSLIPTLPPKM